MRFLIVLVGFALVGYGQAYAEKGAFTPGLGEIMSLQQARHAKLWLAGTRKNWALAAYELDELREGFDDAKGLHPTFESVPVRSLVDKLTPGPLEAIDKAIKAKDLPGFRKSFAVLTTVCNTCHRAANHGFIVITQPGASAFSNQRFESTR
ncbi:MAG TPA: hypothetical protein VMT02_08375 [Burkholderiales bacterium]|nr:hypothetical protein [Burkholderiales bacterium]